MNTTKIDLSSIALPEIGLVRNNMLTNVNTKSVKKQLLGFTCFIIHVGLDRIRATAYA